MSFRRSELKSVRGARSARDIFVANDEKSAAGFLRIKISRNIKDILRLPEMRRPTPGACGSRCA